MGSHTQRPTQRRVRLFARPAPVAVAVVAVLAFPLASSSQAANTWTGTWNTTYGTMILTQTGSSVEGTYALEDGSVKGTVSGDVFSGKWEEEPRASDHDRGPFEFTMSGDGKSFAGTWGHDDTGPYPDPWNGTCQSGDCLQNGTAPPPDPAPGDKGVAKVVRISGDGDVTAKKDGGSSRTLKAGDTVGADVLLFTGIDSEVTLEFPDGARMTIDEMSQVFINDLLSEGSRQTIAISVTLGKLDATVNPQKAFQSDFKVCTPGIQIEGSEFRGTCASVRGTRFSVFYDAVAKVALVSVREGVVVVDPGAPGLADVTVTAGQEIEATATRVSAPAKIGKAGARGGVNRLKARDLVLSRLDRAKKRCRLKAARKPSAIATKPAPKGWRVSVKVSGKAKGKSTWTVTGGKASPKNKLAKRIARGCR